MADYRFNCALQTRFDTLNDAFDNGKWDRPPTAREAIEVVESVRRKGKIELPRKAHEAFDKAIDKVIRWLEARAADRGYTPGSNYDIEEARAEFEYKGDIYRVDIKPGGPTSGDRWFT